ncbi:uncharacterized protein LOC130367512 [Hyla sarda]|uniref:uncharacterized protein LOC130367512 n=1 Tax=Hyla sarda TaxID=327740 RepID=UPI0024C37792|nr:uncharacterized protein LOC130367512 [Hyla sarda]
MASAELRDELVCSICLNIFTDPVTLGCGHNFCRGCIDHFLNTQVRAPHYSCPECRTVFHWRPELQRNRNLHNVAEHFRSSQPPQEEVTRICCTYCVDSPVPAVKSCLHCETSLCDDHLKVHSKSPEHVLTDPSTSLENRKCSVHKKILEYYCTEDDAYICASCLIEEHSGHKILSLKETSEKKKSKMRKVLQNLTTKKQQTEVRVQSLQKRKRIAQRKATGRAERVTPQFIAFRNLVDNLEMRVRNELSRQKEQPLLSHTIEQLERKKDELSRKMRHIEELCNMADPLTVLQDPDTGDLCDPEEEGGGDEDAGGHKTHDVDGEVLTRMLHVGIVDMITYLQTISPSIEQKRKRHRGDQSSLSHTQGSPVSGTEYEGNSVIVRTGGFEGQGTAAGEGIYGQGPVDILLDVNTAANDILLSDDLKNATWTDTNQNRPETAERFQYSQVMSSQKFTSGRHYWDLEVSSSGVWRVGMCYPSIDRRGGQSLIGHNKKSWCLWGGEVNTQECSVMHNGKEVELPHQICSDRVRICLDYEVGELSFYEIRDTFLHIHTYKTTFVEPLHAALYVYESSVKKMESSSYEELFIRFTPAPYIQNSNTAVTVAWWTTTVIEQRLDIALDIDVEDTAPFSFVTTMLLKSWTLDVLLVPGDALGCLVLLTSGTLVDAKVSLLRCKSNEKSEKMDTLTLLERCPLCCCSLRVCVCCSMASAILLFSAGEILQPLYHRTVLSQMLIGFRRHIAATGAGYGFQGIQDTVQESWHTRRDRKRRTKMMTIYYKEGCPRRLRIFVIVRELGPRVFPLSRRKGLGEETTGYSLALGGFLIQDGASSYGRCVHFQIERFLWISLVDTEDMASADLRDELRCSICLNIFTDPVTLTCGHNFCQACIDNCLYTQRASRASRAYSCPQCRAKFPVRPALIKNITLQNVAERFLSSQEEITGICCTYCIYSPVRAVKSCLHCEASLCDDHLRVHSKEAEHVLIEPSNSLQNRKCSVHKKILEYYCTEDATCICVSCCLIGEHSGHKMESLEETAENKKNKMRNFLQRLVTKREKTEEKVKNLKERKKKAQEKAAGETERVTALFLHVRRRLDDLEKKVLSEISRQEKEKSLSLFVLIHQLEIKKDELSRKMRHIEELCNMTDPLTVLQEPDTGDLCDPEEGGGDEDTEGHKLHDVDVFGITGMLHEGFSDIMTYLQTISPAKPGNKRKRHDRDESPPSHTQTSPVSGIEHGSDNVKVRSGVVQGQETAAEGMYGQGPADILLDENTAGNSLLISDDLKTATRAQEKQNRPKTEDRFHGYQVMSSSRFSSGRHYWDVEISISRTWIVGMCYPSIDRQRGHSCIGHNNKSWGLWGGQMYNNECLVIHDNTEFLLPHQITSNRVRICLDYEAGELSFYELCDPIIHIYTFTATFTEPLHAALYLCDGSIKILGGGAAVMTIH